jgi:hypothetical protein
VSPGSRLARAYRHRAQNRRPGARLAGTREGCREDAPRHALGSDRVRCRAIPIHHVKQRSLLRSRGALLRPGFAFLFSIRPMRGEWSAEKAHYLCCRAFRRATVHACEARHASSGTRSPLGAPPWRFWVGGRASISGISSGSVQRAPRSQVVVPGGRGPGPPGALVTSRGRRTPLPAPPSGSSLEDAPR